MDVDIEPAFYKPRRRAYKAVCAVLAELRPESFTSWSAVDYQTEKCRVCRYFGNCPHVAVDAALVWETLVGRDLVPASWLDNPRRGFSPVVTAKQTPAGVLATGRTQFHCGRCERLGCKSEGNCPTFFPSRVSDCLALASDMAGVITAEALVHEFYARVASFGVAEPSRVCWMVMRNLTEMHAHNSLYSQTTDVEQALRAVEAGDPCGYVTGDRGGYRLLHLRSLGRRWDVAVGEGARIPLKKDKRPWLERVPFASIPNPIEPLVELWKLGYALDGVIDDYAVLMCPRELKQDNTNRPGWV